mgnify:CR=1 FL=1
METITMLIGKIGRYLSLLRIADLVDVAIIAFLVYQLLNLVKSTRSANILKGVGIFLVALWLSGVDKEDILEELAVYRGVEGSAAGDAFTQRAAAAG